MLTLTSEHSSITGWAFTEATMLDPVLLKPLSISNICWFPASGRCLLDAELLFLMTFPEMGPDWQDLKMPLLPSLPDSTISQIYLPHSYNPEGTFTGLCSCSLTACFRWQWLQQNHHTLLCVSSHTPCSFPCPSPLPSVFWENSNPAKPNTKLGKEITLFSILIFARFGANSLQCFISLGQSVSIPLSPPHKKPDTTHNNRQHIRMHTVLMVNLDFLNLGQSYFLCYHNVFGELLDSIRSQ